MGAAIYRSIPVSPGAMLSFPALPPSQTVKAGTWLPIFCSNKSAADFDEIRPALERLFHDLTPGGPRIYLVLPNSTGIMEGTEMNWAIATDRDFLRSATPGARRENEERREEAAALANGRTSFRQRSQQGNAFDNRLFTYFAEKQEAGYDLRVVWEKVMPEGLVQRTKFRRLMGALADPLMAGDLPGFKTAIRETFQELRRWNDIRQETLTEQLASLSGKNVVVVSLLEPALSGIVRSPILSRTLHRREDAAASIPLDPMEESLQAPSPSGGSRTEPAPETAVRQALFAGLETMRAGDQPLGLWRRISADLAGMLTVEEMEPLFKVIAESPKGTIFPAQFAAWLEGLNYIDVVEWFASFILQPKRGPARDILQYNIYDQHAIEDLKASRAVHLPVLSRLMQDLLRASMSPGRSFLDYMAGDGQIRALLGPMPEMQGVRWTEMDGNEVLLHLPRAFPPDAVIAATLPQDPLPEEAFDVAVGLSALNKVPPHELAAVLRALWLSLRPGGTLIHVLDKGYALGDAASAYAGEGDFLIPTFDTALQRIIPASVSRVNVARLLEAAGNAIPSDPDLRHFLIGARRLRDDPSRIARALDQVDLRDKDHLAVEKISRYVHELPGVARSIEEVIEHHLMKWLEEAAATAGFMGMSVYLSDITSTEPRVPEALEGHNDLHFYVGHSLWSNNDKVPDGQVRIRFRIPVFAAYKPDPDRPRLEPAGWTSEPSRGEWDPFYWDPTADQATALHDALRLALFPVTDAFERFWPSWLEAARSGTLVGEIALFLCRSGMVDYSRESAVQKLHQILRIFEEHSGLPFASSLPRAA